MSTPSVAHVRDADVLYLSQNPFGNMLTDGWCTICCLKALDLQLMFTPTDSYRRLQSQSLHGVMSGPKEVAKSSGSSPHEWYHGSQHQRVGFPPSNEWKNPSPCIRHVFSLLWWLYHLCSDNPSSKSQNTMNNTRRRADDF